jgi:single-strand DNA-binding protein
MAENLNRWIGTCNLTRDPEMKSPREGLDIANLRVAVNSRVKNSDGSWGEKPNYFDVVCFGAMARNVGQYLKKGSACAIDGRLDWRDWTDDNGNKRQAVQIIADNVQFLDFGKQRDGDGGGFDPARDVSPEPAPAAASDPADDDDIPF